MSKKSIVPVERVQEAVDRWCDANEVTRPRWVSRERWIERREKFCTDSLLTGLIEESELLNVLESFAGPLYMDFLDLLISHGYCYERGYHWSFHLYPLGDPVLPPFQTAERVSRPDVEIPF